MQYSVPTTIQIIGNMCMKPDNNKSKVESYRLISFLLAPFKLSGRFLLDNYTPTISFMTANLALDTDIEP